MEWNYSECGGDSEEDSNPNPMNASFNSEQTEVLQVLRQTLELPKGICAQPEIFWEFFAPQHLWNELPGETREELMNKHLPQFPPDCTDSDRQEKERTLRLLFHREPFRFDSSPLGDFQRNLEEGNYLSDVVKYRAKIAKSERREQRFQECEYISRMASKLAASRKSLLQLAYDSPYNTQLNSPRTAQDRDGSAVFTETVATRARKRYLTEIAHVMAEGNLPLSDSEEEAMLVTSNNNNNKVPRKPGRPPCPANFSGAMTELLVTETGEPKVFGTFAYKPKAYSLPAAESFPKMLFNDDYLRQALRRHKKRKIEDPDYRTTNQPSMYEYLMQDMLSGACGGDFGAVKKEPNVKLKKSTNSKIKTEPVHVKREPVAATSTTTSSSSASGSFNSLLSKRQSPVTVTKSRLDQPAAKKLKISVDPSLLESIKSKGSPPALAAVSDVPAPSSLATNTLSATLRQQPHACFMSLVRSIFCSTPDHRTTFDNLQQTVRAWLQTDKGSSSWITDCHSWLNELPSVVKFLVGEFSEQPEDYVPYIEYKLPLQIYQWIGAGRDTDQHLLPLNRFWLDHRHEFGRLTMPERRPARSSLISSTSNTESPEEILNIPPARCSTTWIMRAERVEEVATFRVQEKQRYECPSSPYTYRLHGYEATVGPVMGVYAQVLNKGLNLLIADRPPCVTLISLVRDAIARLPNGEGTKAHVCELMKASQYIVPGCVLHVIVNTVVERLQKDADRSVHFDQRRKLLIYMHRSKTEADFRKQSVTTQAVTYKKVVMSKQAVSGGGGGKEMIAEDQVKRVGNRVVNRPSPGSMIKMGPLVVKGHQATQQQQGVSPTPPLSALPGQPQNSVFHIRTSKATVVNPTTTTTVMMARNASPSVTGQQLTRMVALGTSSAKDIEANLDAKHPPALIPKLTYTKPTAVKVATSAGVQSFQVASGSGQARPLMSLLTNAQGQSVLMHNNRAVKVTTQGAAGSQSVFISSATNPPALVATSGVTVNSKHMVPRTVLQGTPTATATPAPKLVRASPVAGSVTVVPKKTVTVSPAQISAAVKANQKPIQICTSTGNVSMVEKLSPANGNVLRAAASNLLANAGNKQMIQNIVIRSASPQTQAAMAGKRTVPLKAFTTTVDGSAGGNAVKSILVANSQGAAHSGEGNTPPQNVIKIRTSSANQLGSSLTTTGLPKTITTASGAQFLQIQTSAGGASGGQQYILNSVRQTGVSNASTVNLSNSMVKATAGGKQVTTTPHLVQLPPKTLLKGSPVTARVLKAVSNQAQGGAVASGGSSTPPSLVRTVSGVQSRVMSTTSGGQLVTLVQDAGGSGKGTPIRIGGKAGGTANVIQLQATTNGTGTQYTVLSPGRSVIQVQQQQHQVSKGELQSSGAAQGQPRTQIVNAKMVTTTSGAGDVPKTGIRMLSAANLSRLGGGKPVIISNKLPGNVTNLVRAAAAASGGAKVTPATVTSSAGTNLVIGGQTVKSGSINLNSTNTIVGRSPQGTTTQHVMIGNQLVKIQSAGTATLGGDRGKSVILNNIGQAYKVQQGSQGKLIKTTAGSLKASPGGGATGTPNRVVLVQGPQGQLILPSNLQGGQINLKSLKMISVQQQPQQQQSPQGK